MEVYGWVVKEVLFEESLFLQRFIWQSYKMFHGLGLGLGLDNILQSATPKFNRVLNQPADVSQEGEEQ